MDMHSADDPGILVSSYYTISVFRCLGINGVPAVTGSGFHLLTGSEQVGDQRIDRRESTTLTRSLLLLIHSIILTA